MSSALWRGIHVQIVGTTIGNDAEHFWGLSGMCIEFSLPNDMPQRDKYEINV